jgi:hypothetical protein
MTGLVGYFYSDKTNLFEYFTAISIKLAILNKKYYTCCSLRIGSERSMSEITNVKHYGAAGDGYHDDYYQGF